MMPREALKTLSEPMYYVLLSLTEERCGIEIMSRVDEISGGRVSIGPGTLYTMLSKFESNGLIRCVSVEPNE
jgi:DNA-binding PadR family transcriptional regulator